MNPQLIITNKKIFTFFNIVLLIFVLISIALLVYYSPKLAFKREIEEGFLKVSSEKDWDKYFVFVSLKEAKELLIQAENKGEFKFLFPPFKMPPGDEKLTGVIFRQENISSIETGKPITFIVISGLPRGTVFYAPSNAVARTIINTNRENPYFLIKGEDIKYNWLFYIPGEPILEKGLLGSDKTPKTISFGVPLARLETDNYLPFSLFGGGWQVAFAIEKDKDATLVDLNNVLTKDGKIVILKDF